MSRSASRSYYTDATELARKAVAALPNDTWSHFQLAASNGKRLLMLGKKEQINASKEVRAEIDKAIELDPTNHLAYHALGRWHRRMDEIGGAKRFFGNIVYGSIPKGSYAESEKALRKAIELHPEYLNHYLELGRTLLALKKTDEAGRVLPEGHRPAQDDLQGRRAEGRGQGGAGQAEEEVSRPARAAIRKRPGR